MTGDSFCHEIGTPTRSLFPEQEEAREAVSSATLSTLAAVGGGSGGNRVSFSFRLLYLQEER